MSAPKKPSPFKVSLHFSKEEFEDRQKRAVALLKRENLDGFLITQQEDLYYLTGYDSIPIYFHALYLHADGSMKFISRLPDFRQACHTSIIPRKDILIRPDNRDASPVSMVPEVLKDFGINSPSKRIGYTAESVVLTYRVGKLLHEALEGLCTLVDHSYLFAHELRLVKSEAELRKIRKAAYLVDFALVRAAKVAKNGGFEGDVWREMNGTVYEGGGDDVANINVLASGNRAVLNRPMSGKQKIERQITLEHGAAYHHYHACLMRTFHVGGVTKLARRMHEVNILAMKAAMEALKPGRPAGDVFEGYARVSDENGFANHRMAACGYSLGATFPLSWMDYPMFMRGQDVIVQPNMVFFIHIILYDKPTDTAATFGQTVQVTENGAVSLSRLPPCLTRRQTIAAWKNIRKEDYGFTADEEVEGENIRDVELSDGEDDEDDYDIEYDFSDYQAPAV
ncbi:peptidase M24 [Penicillium herquei]|nr:peptidase M24 [Penicillium herquei]